MLHRNSLGKSINSSMLVALKSMLWWKSAVENIPSKTCKLSNTGSRACKCLANQSLSERVCRSHHCASNDKTGGSKDRNVSLSEQVLEISDERANRRNGERIGDWKPANCCHTQIGADIRQCASSEVEQDL